MMKLKLSLKRLRKKIKPPKGLLFLASIIFYYNGGVMRDGCIVVGEEVWMRYTILKVGVDKEELSSVA